MELCCTRKTLWDPTKERKREPVYGYMCFTVCFHNLVMKKYLWKRRHLLQLKTKTSFSLCTKESHKSSRFFVKLEKKNFLWNPDRPVTSTLKYVFMTAFVFVTFQALFLLTWPLIAVKMVFIPLFMGLGLFMGGYFIVFSMAALAFVSLTSLSFIIPFIVLFSFVLLQSLKRNEKNASSVKRKVSPIQERDNDAWLENVLYRRSQDELELFDRRLRQKTKPLDLKLWSKEDVLDELMSAGLEEYVAIFEEHRIDGKVLSQIGEKNLRDDLGIYKLGDRKRLMVLFGIRE